MGCFGSGSPELPSGQLFVETEWNFLCVFFPLYFLLLFCFCVLGGGVGGGVVVS